MKTQDLITAPDRSLLYFAGLVWALVAVFVAQDVYAAPTAVNSDIGNYLCATVWLAYLDGPIGDAIGTMGIAIIGILATLGRVTWQQALVVAVGCATLYGAATIAGDIGAGC